jgi:hypothetical protein
VKISYMSLLPIKEVERCTLITLVRRERSGTRGCETRDDFANMLFLAPEIISISPTVGATYNQTLTINGNNFGTNISLIEVTFDGEALALILSLDGDTIEVLTPPLAGADHNVTVTVDGTHSVFFLQS